MAPEGTYHVILCPRELAPAFSRFAEERLSADECFLDMGISGEDAILQSHASEETLGMLKTGFLQSLSPERVEAFLKIHPQIGMHPASHELISVSAHE